MKTITIKIDDLDIAAPQGATILETALANKIYIPHLCYHPDLKPAGSCRICLVELDNGRLVTSCRTPVRDGMAVKTKSADVDRARRPVIEMIIANHHMDCKNCAKKGQCELQKIMAYMKIDRKSIQQRLRLPEDTLPVDDSNPFFIRDHNKCVLCGICVRTCQEIQKISAVDFSGRGTHTKISAFGDKPIVQSVCASCGECVIRCPVGALISRHFRRPATEVRTVCSYCGLGCGICLGIRDNEIVNIRGDKESPVNKGHLCVKGRFGTGFVHSPDRLKNPLIRQGKGKSSSFKEVPWQEALNFAADKQKKYRGEEFAMIASARCTDEENYIAQKFARVVMGSNNIDTEVRLCQGSTIAALSSRNISLLKKRSADEIEKASCILVAGADVTSSHPVLGLKIKKAAENGAKLIVASPTEIDLCRFADLRLRSYPGTDLALLMGMCNVIVEEELFDKAFLERRCENFDGFRDALDDFTMGRVERITGVSRDLIEEAARIFSAAKPASILWSTGITQYSNGTNNVHALINLSMLTGNIEHASGLYPLWDLNNSLGACYMGCLPDFYPGYQSVSDHKTRKKFQSAWGKELNPESGLTLTEIPDAVLEGKIKALYIIGSNPLTNMAPYGKILAALKKAKLVISQDIFANDTTRFAHIVLPAASFAEKDGHFTNTEGRSQSVNKALEPAGNSRPDWQILCDLARKSGSKGFDFDSAEEIMSEILSLSEIDTAEKGKYTFMPLQYKPPKEVAEIEYPLILTTKRDLYSCGFLSGKVEGLNMLRTKDIVFINPKDAADFGINDGEGVKVISRWGKINGEARLTGFTPAGLITMNLQEEKIYQLLNPVIDEVAKTPEMKICAVKIESQKEPENE